MKFSKGGVYLRAAASAGTVTVKDASTGKVKRYEEATYFNQDYREVTRHIAKNRRAK